MMWQFAAKVVLTTAVVIAVSEIAKRSSFWGALLASLPLTSLLAFIWIHLETGDVQAVSGLSQGIFWLVIASLPLFLVLPALLKAGWGFWPSLSLACTVTIGAYFALVRMLPRLGIQI